MLPSVCPICLSRCSEEYDSSNRLYENARLSIVECPRCGKYHISHQAIDTAQAFPKTDIRQRVIASSYIYNNRLTEILTPEDVQFLFALPDIPVSEKIHRVLVHIADLSDFVGHRVDMPYDFPPLLSKAWCISADEVVGIVNLLVELRRITKGIGGVCITAEGWAKLEEGAKNASISTQGFVAMRFDESMSDVFTHALAPGIGDAGYTPVRMDAAGHKERIDDEILRQIRKSRFLVADATDNRGGVYFAAGFARGLGIPVFWTARKGERLHFDVRQYNCIFWSPENLEDLRARLANRIGSVLGEGSGKE